MRTHVRDLCLILSGACVLRLALFSGFVLGDDAAYAGIAHQILTAGFPQATGTNVFATRPVLTGLVAASVGAFGWTELAFVLPILAASLVGIAAAYAIGALVVDRPTGALAALTLALFPLDVVYSTTLANDIMVTAISGAGAALAVAAVLRATRDRRTAAWLAVSGGAIIAMSTAVKLSAFAEGVPLAIIAGAMLIRRPARRAVPLGIAGGWVAGQLIIALFFRVTAGAWFANFRVESAFNRTYLLEPYLRDRKSALLLYFKWAFTNAPVGPINRLFFPFGLFFPLAAASLVLGMRWNARRLWFVAVWAVSLFIFFELCPLQLVPAYVPIHRLPRFLHPVALPSAVLIGACAAELVRRGRALRLLAVVALVAYATSSLYASTVAARRHRDVMLDQRFAASLALAHPGPIVADDELLNFFRFRTGYEQADRFVGMPASAAAIPPLALVVVGGSRRVELDPAYVLTHQPRAIPRSWLLVATMPGAPGPSRLAPGRIYLVPHGGTEDGTAVRAPQLASACPAGRSWRLRDTLDVGDVESEAAHAYAIEGATWMGTRTMRNESGDNISDDGRAFLGSQSFVADHMVPGADVCVAVRIDARVRRQVTSWLVGVVDAGRVDTSAVNDAGRWEVKTLLAPGSLIGASRVRFRESFVSSVGDVNTFRVELFQPGP